MGSLRGGFSPMSSIICWPPSGLRFAGLSITQRFQPFPDVSFLMNSFVSKMSLVCVVFCLLGCNESKMELADFTSDGCSLFINSTFANPDLWEDCCTLHDMAYWRGGTEEEEAGGSCLQVLRGKENREFRACGGDVPSGSHRWGTLFPDLVSLGIWLAGGSGLPCDLTGGGKMVEQKLRKFRQGK